MALGGVTVSIYDAYGNLLSVTDANGHTTRYEYNAFDQLIRVTDAAGGVTSYTYDNRGNSASMTDASGHTWCYHTQMPIGPDGLRAAPEYCGPDRRCYRSALAQPVAYVPPKLNQNPEV